MAKMWDQWSRLHLKDQDPEPLLWPLIHWARQWVRYDRRLSGLPRNLDIQDYRAGMTQHLMDERGKLRPHDRADRSNGFLDWSSQARTDDPAELAVPAPKKGFENLAGARINRPHHGNPGDHVADADENEFPQKVFSEKPRNQNNHDGRDDAQARNLHRQPLARLKRRIGGVDDEFDDIKADDERAQNQKTREKVHPEDSFERFPHFRILSSALNRIRKPCRRYYNPGILYKCYWF